MRRTTPRREGAVFLDKAALLLLKSETVHNSLKPGYQNQSVGLIVKAVEQPPFAGLPAPDRQNLRVKAGAPAEQGLFPRPQGSGMQPGRFIKHQIPRLFAYHQGLRAESQGMGIQSESSRIISRKRRGSGALKFPGPPPGSMRERLFAWSIRLAPGKQPSGEP
jgi:hypothetical protein